MRRRVRDHHVRGADQPQRGGRDGDARPLLGGELSERSVLVDLPRHLRGYDARACDRHEVHGPLGRGSRRRVEHEPQPSRQPAEEPERLRLHSLCRAPRGDRRARASRDRLPAPTTSRRGAPRRPAPSSSCRGRAAPSTSAAMPSARPLDRWPPRVDPWSPSRSSARFRAREHEARPPRVGACSRGPRGAHTRSRPERGWDRRRPARGARSHRRWHRLRSS